MAWLRAPAGAERTLGLPHVPHHNRAIEGARIIAASRAGCEDLDFEQATPASTEGSRSVRRSRVSDSKKFQTWSKVAKGGFRKNIVAFGRGMPAVDYVEQFDAAQIGCC